MSLPEAKTVLQDHLGVELTASEYQFLVDLKFGAPSLTRDAQLFILGIYQRGHEEGYAEAKFTWEGEPT